MRVRDARILELEHELDLEKEANAPGKAALAKLAMIPPLGVSSERGRPVPPPTRKVAMHMMPYMAPPSGVVPNIIAVLLYFAPFLLSDIHLPTISCVRSIREEMLFISQTLSANKIGFAKRVKQLCHDGGDIGGIAGVTVSEHITNAGGRDETVILDALAITVGKTAQLECTTIEETLAKLSTNLDKWKEELGSDGGGVIAPSENIGFHQIKHGGTMSDACPQALLLDVLIEKNIQSAVKAQYSPDEWEALGEEKQEDELALYSTTCHHHIRNVGVAHAETAVNKFMASHLEADLARIPATNRINGKVSTRV